MIGAILDKPVNERLIGSTSLATLAAWMGADILRVHDVAATSDALKAVNAIRSV
jgi:dihydropteroate synthase